MNERKKRKKERKITTRAPLCTYIPEACRAQKKKKVSHGYNTQRECVLRVDDVFFFFIEAFFFLIQYFLK